MTLNSLLAGDVGVVVEIGPVDTGAVDGTSIASAILRVARVLDGPNGPVVDWPNTIVEATEDSVTIQHVTPGTLTLKPGEYVGRVFYLSGSVVLVSTEEFTFTVRPTRIPYPS